MAASLGSVVKQLLRRESEKEAQAGDAAPVKLLCPRHLGGKTATLSHLRADAIRRLRRGKHRRWFLDGQDERKLELELVPLIFYLVQVFFFLLGRFHFRYLDPELVIFRHGSCPDFSALFFLAEPLGKVWCSCQVR